MRAGEKWGRGAVVALAAALLPAFAAQLPEARRTVVDVDDPVVELPPMIVAETAKTPPWLYLRTPYGEYLSRCTVATTREFVTADLRQFQLLAGLVPPAYTVKMDAPVLVILDRLELKQAGDAVMQDMLELANRAPQEGGDRPVSNRPVGRIQTLPNLRIDDTDMNALFAYLDEHNYEGGRMTITPSYVRALLDRRIPDLPSWVIEGVVAIFGQSSFLDEPISVRPFVWLSLTESGALQRNPEWPRALLPMGELFAGDSLRAEPDRHPQRIAVWRAQTALFFRWAMDPRNAPAREAFWKLAGRASGEPVTEALFEECFGFGFAEMRDRLSDYLPVAVKEPMRIDPGRLDRRPSIEPKPAAKEQIARILGEWERLEIFQVKARHPQFVPQYALEARRTLRKGYDLGNRDPQLLAALGLCEIDAGDDSGAPFFLERAAAAGVLRPRVYYELGRMRFAELTRGQPPAQTFHPADIERVVAPLRTAFTQAPSLGEVVGLFTIAWLRSDGPPPPGDFALLLEGAGQFPGRPLLIYRIALVHAKYGRLAAARTLLARALAYPVEEPLRSRMVELQTALNRPVPGPVSTP